MSSVYSRFTCGDIVLEGELHLPEGTGLFPAVVVCHPHPLYGGDMENNVVVGVCQALVKHSIAAFRFNFRGVGDSLGTFGGGIAEREDVRAAIAFVLSAPNIDSKRIGLVGYSFGASVALPVALEDEWVSLLALVSPALSDSGWEQLTGYSKPKLVIVGDADSFLPLTAFQQHIKDVTDSKQYQVVRGADHFWWGHEEEVAGRIVRFFVAGFCQTE